MDGKKVYVCTQWDKNQDQHTKIIKIRVLMINLSESNKIQKW